MKSTAVVELYIENDNSFREIEIPLEITANDLIVALNETYDLGMDINDLYNCHLVMENPLAFLHGNRTLQSFGIHQGSRIRCMNAGV